VNSPAIFLPFPSFAKASEGKQLPKRCHLDMETFAYPKDRWAEDDAGNKLGWVIKGVDLRVQSVYNYARNPGSGCYMFAVKMDREPTFCVILWKHIQLPTGPACVLKTEAELFREYPQLPRFLAAIQAGVPVVAHNAAFERLCWNLIVCGGRGKGEYRYFPHWPKIQIAQQDCTMARANAMSLPAGLDNLANVLRLKTRKMDGKLMMLMAMSSPHNLAVVTPESLREEAIYCANDVETEFEADCALYPLDPIAKRLWILDQEINDRGIPVDRRGIEKALKIVHVAKHTANVEIKALTGGQVSTAQQALALKDWLNGRLAAANRTDAEGNPLQIPGVSAYVLKSFEEDHGWGEDEIIPRVLELREYASRASVAKLESIIDQLRFSPDDRVRGQYTFMGANTGRFTGRGFQPQNMVRFDDDTEAMAECLLAVLNSQESDEILMESPGALRAAEAAAHRIQMLTGKNAVIVIGKCMRAFLKAPSE
jgi:hypothetical protein